MTTVRDKIMAKAVTLLKAEGVNVFRNRMSDPKDKECPCFMLYDFSQTTNYNLEYDRNHHTAILTIEGIVVSETDEELGPMGNELYAKAVKALAAPDVFGDLVISVEEVELNFSVDKRANGPASAGFDLSFEVKYTTSIGDARSVPSNGG